MINSVWLIPLIMFTAALINGLGVKKLGKLAGHIAWLAMAICCAISYKILFEVMHLAHASDHHGVLSDQASRVFLWNWFDIPNFFGEGRHFIIDMAFRVDQLTSLFLCFVSFIGTLVFIYATGYMKEKHDGHLELDPGYARFFAYVCLFAASMFTLILADNMAVMFIGWEGVGLCSYLLIGYFFEKPFTDKLSCSDAGRKAFIVNRIGDAGLIVGMGLVFWGLGTIQFSEINQILTTGKLLNGETIPDGFLYGGITIMIATLAMFLGATGKSAQIPLFTWLPDAMAGPTPVSALIHAATMVTAGVYMIARLNVMYFLSPTTMTVIAVIGGLTAFAAATMAMTQRGIKKALAYSTVSQLGYMFLGLGVGAMAGGIFHVFTHAFFKGCLFLCAGSVIHAMHHQEDMFKMGGLRKYMKLTWITYFIATLAIAGFPFTSGFFSKDEILFSAYVASGSGFPFLWFLGVITALMTAFYMGRTLWLTFHGSDDRIDHHTKEHLHESPANMTFPLIALAVCALVLGFLNVPKAMNLLPEHKAAAFHHFLAPVVDQGSNYVAELELGWDDSMGEANGPLVIAALNQDQEIANVVLNKDHKKTEINLAIMSGLLAIVGLGISFFMYGRKFKAYEKQPSNPLWKMSFYCWGWDSFYNTVFKNGTMAFARSVWKVDMHFIDGIINGLGDMLDEIAQKLRGLQSGRVQMYGLVMVIGVCIFIAYFAIGMTSFLSNSYERFEPTEKEPTAQIQAPVADESDTTITAQVSN